MDQDPKTLDGFLTLYKADKNDKASHTKIGNQKFGIFGGSYNIPEEKLETFYKLYHKEVFINKKMLYLTERQQSDGGPVLIDLDERYSSDIKERQHTNEHILELLGLYIDKIKELINIDEDEITFPVFIMEKDDINSDNPDYVKDGIHIFLGLMLSNDAKILLRKNVIEDIEDVVGDLPLINSYEDLVDFGIARGTTNWQLYGSRKPGHEPYKLKKIFNVTIDSEEEEPVYNEILVNSKTNYLKLLPKISCKNKDLYTPTLKEEIVKHLSSQKKKKKIKKPKVNVINANLNNIVDCKSSFPLIDSESRCNAIINYILDYAKENENFEIKYIHELTMVLNEDYYVSYDSWMKVALILKDISELLYPSWLLFSSKSDNFTWSDNDCYEFWNNLSESSNKTDSDTLSVGSLKFWAKKCDAMRVMEIDDSNVDNYLLKTLAPTAGEYDIAKLVHAIYQGSFKCCNIPKKMWYEYSDGKWSEIDSGTTLREALSKRISKIFYKKVCGAMAEAENIEDEDEKKKKHSEIFKLSEMAMNLNKTSWKQNIMREAQEVFFDKKFLNKLDTNPDLLCFKNGILDMENKLFRKGDPNDYVSLSTNTNYIPIDPENEDHMRIKGEIINFMEQLFPNPNLNKYMWEHLASTLRGKNRNQTFNIYTGSGRNGKSKLVTLMGMVLGDYKGSVPLTLITRERSSLGSVTPEVAQLQGIRYAVMQEPSKKTKLNEGPMKELVGEDPIQGRALYKDTVTFIPQFKLVVCTNHLFDITSNDDGTWRRIRIVDFEARFVDEPSEDPADKEFKVDRDIDSKFEEWAPIFTSMLVEKLFETNGLVEDCPEVMAASMRYKAQQDHFAGFIKERISKHEGGVIKRSDVKSEFEEWYSELYSGKIPSGKELYEYLSKALGEPSKRGWSGYTLYHSYDLVDDDNIKANPV